VSGEDGLAAALAAHGLPPVPVPQRLAARVRGQGGAAWGTRRPPVALHRLRWYLEELEQRPPGEYLLLGPSGHGMASRWLHLYLVHEPLALFLQCAQADALSSRPDPAGRLRARVEAAGELVRAVGEAREAGRLPEWARLEVVASEPAGESWRVAGVEDPPEPGAPADAIAAAADWVRGLAR